MMKRNRKRMVVGVLVAVATFFGLHTYLIVKPVDYPINYDKQWNEGELLHILSTVSHERFLIKTSLKQPLKTSPVLEIDGQKNPRYHDKHGRPFLDV